MLKRYHEGIGFVFRLVDASVVVGAWLASFGLRFYVEPFATVREVPSFSQYAALTPLVAVLWMATFQGMRVYESRRMLGRMGECLRVLKAHGAALLAFIAITYMFEEYKYSRLVMAYFAGLGAVALVAFRASLRSALRHLRARGFDLRHVVAVGQGAALQSILSRIDRFPELGLRVRGVLTADGSVAVEGRETLGRYEDVGRIVRELDVDEVHIALPPSQSHLVDRLLDLLKDETVDVRVVPDMERYVTLGCEIEDFDGLPVVRINDSPLSGPGAFAKRATDLLLASVALVVLSPVLALIALLVRLSSPGPVFYRQERLGLDGRAFQMYKFRSMKVDAEASGPRWAQAVDDRRTAFGTFLRKTSLDELPQLWNVVRGDMSLVGPRPERPVFVKDFRHSIPHYNLRHKVRAGITGWAQVNGWRGNTSLTRRIECDLFYIKNWSYVLDIKILFLTVWKGFVNKNAY